MLNYLNSAGHFCLFLVLGFTRVGSQTSGIPNIPISTTNSSENSSDYDVTKYTTQKMTTYQPENVTTVTDNFTEYSNYTTITPEVKTLNPNLTLEGKSFYYSGEC